jgi:response regulator NasT
MKILIAEDEPIIRMGLKAMLEEMGHTVTAVANGREALEHHRRHLPELAVLDIDMPFTNGLQAAQTMSKLRPIPILILTALSQNHLIEKATELPIHGYLIKPVTPQAMSAAIAVAVKRFAETKRLTAEKERLAGQLEDRKIIERAKGKLMAAGMTEEEAYQTLQQEARSSRKLLREVAEGHVNN